MIPILLIIVIIVVGVVLGLKESDKYLMNHRRGRNLEEAEDIRC